MGFFSGLFGRNKEGREAASEVIQQVTSENQFTLFQDFNHDDKSVNNFIHSKEFVQDLAKGGTKHLVLEGLESNQKSVDAYMSGKMSREDFEKTVVKEGWVDDDFKNINPKDYASNLSETLDAARENGIKIHYCERGNNEPYSDLREGVNSELQLTKDGGNGYKTVGELREAYSKFKSPEGKKTYEKLVEMGFDDKTALDDPKFQKNLDDKFFKERNDNDKQLADDIAKATKGEKTAVVYGAAHGNKRDGSNGKDLDEHLADKGKTGKIGVTNNPKDTHVGEAKEMPATIINTNANGNMPGRPVQVQQHKDASVGGEVSTEKNDMTRYSELTKGFDIKSFQQSMGGQQQVRDDGRPVGEAAPVNQGVQAEGHQQAKAAEQSASAGR
jgi:hypothetical protein